MKKRTPIKLPDSFCALLEYLRNRGYAESSVLNYESHARWITQFMRENGYDAYTAEAYAAVLKHVDNGVEYEALSEFQKRRYHCATVLYEFQQTGNYTFRRKKAEEVLQGGLKKDIESFMEYRKPLLRAGNTEKQYRLDLLRFNIFLDEMGICDVSQITTALILQYIQERMSRFTQPVIRHALTSIRQFLFYLHETGRTEANLSLVVPNCSAPPPQKIPSIYSKEEIEQLLGVMDRADPRGKRDYAMILIASRLGLRSSDICQLKFSELDWKQDRILLKQKKTGAQIELPLLSDIGEAIIDYLKYGRPQSDLPFVFLKHVPPYDGVTGAAFTNAIKAGIVPMMEAQVSLLKQYMLEQNLLKSEEQPHPLFRNKRGEKLTRAGISYILDKYVSMAREANPELVPDNISCHCLRHSKAMHLLQSGVNLVYIRDFLGHYSVQTTEVYAKADSRQKRQALEKAYVDVTPNTDPVWQENSDLLEWLVSLGK